MNIANYTRGADSFGRWDKTTTMVARPYLLTPFSRWGKTAATQILLKGSVIMAYNRVTLMGRITHDLELKQTTGGVSVLSFLLAVDRSYETNGQRESDFIPVVCWRNTAEFVNKYFAKGRMILVEGELSTRKYTNNDGKEVRAIEVNVSSVSFTGEPAPQQQST